MARKKDSIGNVVGLARFFGARYPCWGRFKGRPKRKPKTILLDRIRNPFVSSSSTRRVLHGFSSVPVQSKPEEGQAT